VVGTGVCFCHRPSVLSVDRWWLAPTAGGRLCLTGCRPPVACAGVGLELDGWHAASCGSLPLLLQPAAARSRAFGPRPHPPPSHPLTWCLSRSELLPPTVSVADVWNGCHCWWRLLSFPRHHRPALLVRPPCGGFYCARPRAHARQGAGVQTLPASPFAPRANQHQRITCWALLVSLCLSFAVPEEPPRASQATVRC